ncbi:MAG: hypothetical protein ABI234_07275 [Ktedonobacteraceae bacterium]
MNYQTITPEERFAMIIETLQSVPGVTPPWDGPQAKGFGALGLKIHAKTFAMLLKDKLVLKLPQSRIDALIAEGYGERFHPHHDGRVLKEWMNIESTFDEEWLPLAREAMEFVNSLKVKAK